jgi:hypothetical protein
MTRKFRIEVNSKKSKATPPRCKFEANRVKEKRYLKKG